jgi:vacuolar-type H+-ATPase subunit E/Vma4
MSSVEEILPSGDKMKKAICWISEMIKEHPEKKRHQIISEAEIRMRREPEYLQDKNAHQPA